MSKSIPISKKYGLNPSVLQCPICGRDFEVALFGGGLRDKKTHKELEAPHRMAMPNQICPDCENALKQGTYIFIEVRDGETGPNPHRLGGFVGITTEAAKRMFPDIQGQVHYMEHTMFRQIFGEALAEQEKEQQQN